MPRKANTDVKEDKTKKTATKTSTSRATGKKSESKKKDTTATAKTKNEKETKKNVNTKNDEVKKEVSKKVAVKKDEKAASKKNDATKAKAAGGAKKVKTDDTKAVTDTVEKKTETAGADVSKDRNSLVEAKKPDAKIEKDVVPATSGMETYENKVSEDKNNALLGICLAGVACLVCFFLLFNMGGVKSQTIPVGDSENVKMTLPGNWYPAEDNYYFELKDKRLTFKLTAVTEKEIEPEIKEKFFEEIKQYFVYQDLGDENAVCITDEAGDVPTITFFRYFPDIKEVAQLDFQNIEYEEALKIFNSVK